MVSRVFEVRRIVGVVFRCIVGKYVMMRGFLWLIEVVGGASGCYGDKF